VTLVISTFLITQVHCVMEKTERLLQSWMALERDEEIDEIVSGMLWIPPCLWYSFYESYNDRYF
jgi:hypothetical protein